MKTIKVLFLCIHNSARSQMAEAYLKILGGEKFIAESAGLEAGKLNFFAVQVMNEDGIDIAANLTKDVNELIRNRRTYNFVITVCDEASIAKCPFIPGTHKKLNWNFADPSAFNGTDEEKLQQTRMVRDEIRRSVLEFVEAVNNSQIKS